MASPSAWLLAAAVAALPGAVAAQPAPGDPAAQAPQSPAIPAPDPVAALAAELRATDPPQVGDRARADPRILELPAAERARLLAALDEGVVWWAPILNVYPGLGLGSLASRDWRGAWLTAADILSFSVFTVGLIAVVADAPASSDAGRGHGRALVNLGLAGLAASRVAGFILPFTFHGRRHRELEGVLSSAPPPRLGAFVAPLAPGSGPGGCAGLALAF